MIVTIKQLHVHIAIFIFTQLIQFLLKQGEKSTGWQVIHLTTLALIKWKTNHGLSLGHKIDRNGMSVH